MIGINAYQTIPTLSGAVADADAFSAYLSDNLSVPEGQIINLRDKQATRAEILHAFKALQTNPNIKYGDPVVIYYAGHGSTIKAPPGWNSGDGMIQVLVPQDFGLLGRSNTRICPIPDRTIAALLNGLADSKGNNIVSHFNRQNIHAYKYRYHQTVIFDCCHSASGSREDKDVPGRIARAVKITDFGPLPLDLDIDILGANTRASVVAKGFSHRDLRSHVLLAACGSDELAYETDARGDYTRALLGVLRSGDVNKLTYKGCMHRLPSLPK